MPFVRTATLGGPILKLLYLLSLFAAATTCSREHTYTVAVPYLPARFDPRHNRINVNHYILLQMYWPLIGKASNERGLIESEFLDSARTTALTTDFSQYRLCLTSNIRYSDGSVVSAKDLRATLEFLHAKREQLSPILSLDVDGSCVEVRMENGDAYYFDKLTSVDSTVLKLGAERGDTPVGRGPYRLATRGDNLLRLKWTGFGPAPDFPWIEFVKVQGVDEALSRGLMDVNLLYWGRQPPADIRDLARLNRDILRTYSIILAIPGDEAFRRCFAACLDPSAFGQAVLPFEMIKSGGYLPRGLPGSDAEVGDLRRVPPGCSCNDAAARVVDYYNPLPERHEAISEFFRSATLPARVEVQHKPWETLLGAIRSHTPMLYAIGMDTATSQVEPMDESAVFFEAFYGEHRCIDENLDDVEMLTRAALREPDRGRKYALYREAHRALLQSGYVVPLGQHPSWLFYPRGIRNVEFADPYIAYPRIERTRRR
jgi:hypothetical protein